MSLDSTEMNNGFHFYWDIENIDICFNEECITSPIFAANNLNETEWCLKLYPSVTENKFTLVLTRTDNGNGPESISIDFVISVYTSDGIQKVLKDEKKAGFQTGSSASCYWIYRSIEDLYTEDLTIYCYMKQNAKQTFPHVRCWARTILGKEQRRGVWKVKNFKYLSPGCKKKFILCSTVTSSPHIEISGTLSKKSRLFHIELLVTHSNPIFIFGRISVVTANGDLKFPTIGILHFNSPTSIQTYKFPLILNQEEIAPEIVTSHSRSLLPQGTLTLLYELHISTDLQYSEVIESNYLLPKYREPIYGETSINKTEELPKSDMKEEDTNDTRKMSENFDTNNSTPQTLKQDLKNFYKQKKHCDITLEADNKSFPAHRSILCSRSSVFSSMLDHEMKEKINKKVDIVDMDADTLDRFLIFLYSETLEDLQWDRATKLLYAANKYQVESLKIECSSFLMSHLSLSNVCEALILADLYQNDALRTQCQDFILENADEVFPSNEWETFTVSNPLLSAKMLQRYFSFKK